MARGIGDNETATGRSEEAVGHIDRDALLAFGLQPIHQQRKVQALALGAKFLGVRLERFQLILEDQLGLVEQTANQRRLAIVHAAASNEAQSIHQKYPSCFLRSMEPAPSWSMMRPWRSDVVAPRVSATISSRLTALLSIAAVSG